MSLEDREWFQEGRREREKLIAKDAAKARPAVRAEQRRALDEIVKDHERGQRAGSGITAAWKAFGLLVVLCLAVFGALSLVKHFTGQ